MDRVAGPSREVRRTGPMTRRLGMAELRNSFVEWLGSGRAINCIAVAVAGICLLVAAGAWVWLTSDGPKYTRSECIVRIRVEHPPGGDVRSTENIMFETFTDFAIARKLPVMEFSYGNPDRSSVYVIYTDRCELKFEMTGAIARFYLKKYPHGARIAVTHDAIQPSLEFMNFNGDVWIDGTPVRRHELGLD